MNCRLEKRLLNLDLDPLISKASNAAYKKYLQKKYGLRTCKGDLTDPEIEDLWENIDLLKYILCNDICGDKEKLIETLI